MVNRIFSFIESQQLTPTEFADKIGVSRASISSIKTGRTQPTLSLVEKIRQHFPDIDINWLIFGVGSAMVEKSETTTEEVGLSDELMVVEDNNDSVLSSVANDYEAVYIAESPQKTSDKNNESISPINETTKTNKIIKKVILLYDDGSFEEFNK